MWSLIMGASYSSDEEGGEETNIKSRSLTEDQGESVIHKPREEGNGMERLP